jgi:hypothetical protein
LEGEPELERMARIEEKDSEDDSEQHHKSSFNILIPLSSTSSSTQLLQPVPTIPE